MKGSEKLLLEEQIERIRDEIHDRFPDIDWPEPVMEPVYFGKLKKKHIPDRQAIIDINNGHCFDIVSNRYHLVTHEEVVYDLLSNVPNEFGEPDIKIDIYSHAARVRVDMEFSALDNEVKEGDPVCPRITGYSSYDRSCYHGIVAGAVQLICTNGLVAFQTDTAKRRKHIIGSSVTKDELCQNIRGFLERFSETTELWKYWANKQISQTEIQTIMEELPFSEPEREKILELPLINNDGKFLKQLDKVTLWDLNSAATQFARHEINGRQRQNDLEVAIADVMYRAA